MTRLPGRWPRVGDDRARRPDLTGRIERDRFPAGTSSSARARFLEDVPVTWSTPVGGRAGVAT